MFKMPEITSSDVGSNLVAGLIATAGLALFAILWRSIAAAIRGNRVFVAVPMAALQTQAERDDIKSKVGHLIQKLEHKHGLSVYCAYTTVQGQFDFGRKAAVECFREIRKCRYFVAILTEKMPTSAYVEIGYALAARKDVLLLHTHGALPYLLEEIESSGLLRSRVSVKRQQVGSLDAAVDRLAAGGLDDFPGWAKFIRAR